MTSSGADESVNDDSDTVWHRMCNPTIQSDIVFADGDNLCGYSLFDEIQIFNPSKNEWKQKALDTQQGHPPEESSLAYDEKERTLWAHTTEYDDTGDSSLLLALSLDTAEVVQKLHEPLGMQRLLLAVGDIMHFISIVDDSCVFRHMMLNKKTGAIVKQQEYPADTLPGCLRDERGNFLRKLIHVEMTDNLYLFVVKDMRSLGPAGPPMNVLLRYSINQDAWTVLDGTKHQTPVSPFIHPDWLRVGFSQASFVSITISRQQQYIVMFGGLDPTASGRSQQIAVYDVQRNFFRKCSVQLPSFKKHEQNFDCVLLRSRKKEVLPSSSF